MSYRFLKVTTYYPQFLAAYYERFPNIVNESYQSQLDHLMRQEFGWSDYYSRHLRNLGVDAHELVTNAKPLQDAWARENGYPAGGKGDLVQAQIESVRPDVILFQDSHTFNGEWVRQLRERVRSIKVTIGWCCVPFSIEQAKRFSVFDFVLTCTPGFLHALNASGLRAYQLNHAFEPAIIDRLGCSQTGPETDLLFIGSIIGAEGFHNVRKEVLEKLYQAGLEIKIFGSAQSESTFRVWLKRGAYVCNRISRAVHADNILRDYIPAGKKILELDRFPVSCSVSPGLRSAMHAPLYGLNMFEEVSRSKISFNAHIDAVGEYAGNIRLFEVTGVGSCLVTDWKKNIADLFDPDYEVVTYRSASECIEKINWLLGHPEKRQDIARAGQIRCLRDHSYRQRASQLDDWIRNEL